MWRFIYRLLFFYYLFSQLFGNLWEVDAHNCMSFTILQLHKSMLHNTYKSTTFSSFLSQNQIFIPKCSIFLIIFTCWIQSSDFFCTYLLTVYCLCIYTYMKIMKSPSQRIIIEKKRNVENFYQKSFSAQSKCFPLNKPRL